MRVGDTYETNMAGLASLGDEKRYQNSDGETCSLWQMCRTEFEWAASRIREGEKLQARIDAALAVLEVLADEFSKGRLLNSDIPARVVATVKALKGETV